MATDHEREDADIAAEIERDPVEGGRRLVETLARRHRITIDWRQPARMPRGVLGRADWKRRSILIPVFGGTAGEAPAQFAVALHELAHILSPRCSEKVPPHQRPWRGGCLFCEVIAWRLSLELSVVAFTAKMFEALKRGLEASIAEYPAPPAAVAAARELMRPETLAANLAQRQHLRDCQTRQVAVRQSLKADAARAGLCACVNCGRPSDRLVDEGPLCAGCHIDRRITDQRRRRALMHASPMETRP